MSDDLSLSIQQAVIALLKTNPAVSAIVGVRVYDDVPPDAAFPHICLTGWQHVPAETDCFDMSEYFFDAQVYSRKSSRNEAASIAKAVRKALARASVSVDGSVLSHRSTNYFTEPDGLTQRAVLNFVVTSDQF